MIVLTVANQKGGVGKTTTASNVAWLLAAEHQLNTVVLDLNAQASLTTILQHQPAAATLCEWLVDDRVGVERALCPVVGQERLWLMEGSEALAVEGRRFLEPDLSGLSQRIQTDLSAFEAVVIDTPPELGDLAVSALVAATDILIVTQVLSQSLAGLVKLMATIEGLRGGGELPRLAGILPTFVEHRPRHHREALFELQKEFGELLLPVIRKSIVIPDADLLQIPVVAASPQHPVSETYRTVTQTILSRMGG